jgi:predicted AlkP superfamily pyrophosphatase or phosphodiesterase
MGIEYAMHKFGLKSEELNKKIIELDNTLEMVIPMWVESGYDIIVTTELGKNSKVIKKTEDENLLPLWVIGKSFNNSDLGSKISKEGIAGVLYEILNIKKPKKFINCNVN